MAIPILDLIRCSVLIPILAGTLLMTSFGGCGREEAQVAPAAEEALSAVAIQDHLSQAFVRGLDYNGTRIKADHYDQLSRRLINVQITARGILLNAERAEVEINLAENTGRIILYDAVSAHYELTAGSSDEDGKIATFDRLELDPFPLSGA